MEPGYAVEQYMSKQSLLWPYALIAISCWYVYQVTLLLTTVRIEKTSIQ